MPACATPLHNVNNLACHSEGLLLRRDAAVTGSRTHRDARYIFMLSLGMVILVIWRHLQHAMKSDLMHAQIMRLLVFTVSNEHIHGRWIKSSKCFFSEYARRTSSVKDLWFCGTQIGSSRLLVADACAIILSPNWRWQEKAGEWRSWHTLATDTA